MDLDSKGEVSCCGGKQYVQRCYKICRAAQYGSIEWWRTRLCFSQVWKTLCLIVLQNPQYYQMGVCRRVIRLFFIKLVCWLGLLCNTVHSQGEISESVTGSASFPDLGITCIGNAAVFITSLLRGRLDLDMGARDVLAIITGPKLNDINGFGVTTCGKGEYRKASVVMLSNHAPNSSIKHFMKYMFNAHHVESVLLHCFPFRSFEDCGCVELCRCIVFSTVEGVTKLLALRMPRTLKRLPDSRCLLPCLQCLAKGCHGYNQELDLLDREEPEEGWPEDLMHVGFRAAAVCEALNYITCSSMQEERFCICIPMYRRDDWTKVLSRCLKSKDKENRGVTVMASDVLDKYIQQSGGTGTGTAFLETEEYNNISLIVPRLTEVVVNLILTGWFRVDGFSSSLVARRAIRDYVVDSKGSGFAANAFLTKAMIKSNSNNTDVCQVLTFRGNHLGIRTLSFMVGCVNLICTVIWALLLVFEGGTAKWYDNSIQPSKPRVAVMMAAILISLGMDCLDHILETLGDGFRWRISRKKLHMLWVAIILDILCIVLGGAVGGSLGMKAFGRWIYSVMQGIVWVKWGIGSYLIGEHSIEYYNHRRSWGSEGGVLVYSSAFLLNAILAGVRAKWRYRKAVAD